VAYRAENEETAVNLTKREIATFLQGFKDHLSITTASLDRRNVINEAAFAYEIVLKNLREYLAKQADVLNGRSPRDFILAEDYALAKEDSADLMCGTPTWEPGHPFHKAIATSAKDLYARWSGQDPKGPKSTFGAVCPDLALLAPYRVVFECKYFTQPGEQNAVSQLVSGLYEAFFYRAMPTAPLGTPGLKHGWDYEYACFLAYDATNNRRLRKAWDALKDTRNRFWDQANIYVMILPE
jgi:hypothetical protein